MNKVDFQNSCDEFELLISCSSDDELSFDEQMQLALHLEDCRSCRIRRDSFGRLNQLVAQLGSASVLANHQTCTRPGPANSLDKPRRTDRPRWTALLMRAIPVAVVATVVAGLLAPNGSSKSTATATELQAAEIVVPLVSYSAVNLQRMRDQQALVETLELELRALKLEIASIHDQEKSKSLAARIEALLEKTKSIEMINIEIP